MFTGLFWKDTAERVIVTMAEALLAVLLTDGFDLLAADWKATASVVLLAGLASLLKAIIAGKVVDNTVSPASLAADSRGF